MYTNFNGIQYTVTDGRIERVSFDGSNDHLNVRYGAIFANFPVNRIPDSVNINLTGDRTSPREVYLRSLFENVLYASLELYVLSVCRMMSDAPGIDALTRKYVGTYIHDELCRIFSSKVRNHDILVTCDDSNNPPEIVNENNIMVSIYFKPVFGELHFPPIHVSRSGVH